MTLNEFIEQVKSENNITYETEDILDQITDKAKEHLNGKDGGIDDETIKNWIMNYDPNYKPVKKNKQEKNVEEKAEKTPAQQRTKIVGTKDKDKVEGSWGIQESLF